MQYQQQWQLHNAIGLGSPHRCHMMGAACRVVCNTHHPWYTTDTSFKEFDQMRQSMEPLLYQYGVDVFYNGHVHSYER